jgi:hypothetical protein
MKALVIPILIGVALCSLALAVADHHGGEKKKLRHVVSFKFKASASKAEITKVVDAFAALPDSISTIKAFEWGTNVSPEKHDKGFTHLFTLTFNTAEGRDAYLVHPEHQAFGKGLGPVLEDVFVIDYWATH